MSKKTPMKQRIDSALAKTDDSLIHLKQATNVLSLTNDFVSTITAGNITDTLARAQMYMGDLKEVLISIHGQLQEVADELAEISESEE